MGPPGAVDREFVYIDFVFFSFRVASSFSLLASFVLFLPSLTQGLPPLRDSTRLHVVAAPADSSAGDA